MSGSRHVDATTKADSVEHEIALRAFRRIADAVPHLRSIIDPAPTIPVELTMDIPAQPGLDFDVHLNLQNGDELHLCAGALWVEWFPCTTESLVEDFVESVVALLVGDYRILEHRRGRKAVSAKLQRPEGPVWKTVATWGTLSLPWPKKTSTILQNRGRSWKP